MSEERGDTPRPGAKTDAISNQTNPSTPADQGVGELIGASPKADNPAGEQLLTALWRTPDRIQQIGILDRQNSRFSNLPVADVAEAIAQAQQRSDQGAEVYFACAEYLTPDSRTAANATSACGFWLDVDCGEEKATAGKGYATIPEAEAALDAFCHVTRLPRPTHVVHSGGGLHLYWVADTAIARDDWQAHARQLKALTQACRFLADDSRTADIASVLRIPGTLNHKLTPPRPVTLAHASAGPIERSVLLEAIAHAYDELCGPKKARPAGDSCGAVIPLDTMANVQERPDINTLVSALATLDPDCDEETWKLRRVAPLAKAAHDFPQLADLLHGIAQSWSSGELTGKPSRAWVTPGGNGQTGEQAFEAVWRRFRADGYTGSPVTLGTLYHDAKKAGWRDPAEAASAECLANALPFPNVEPYPDAVDPALLLDDIVATIRRFIVMEPEQADAVALWIAFTWLIEATEVAPLAVINAPEKACGKSQLLDVMGRLAARPLPVSNTTPAALFRSVALWKPTLLVDEADTFARNSDELKGIINAGHTRANAYVLRVVGENHEPKRFSVWCPKALAGISLEKHLPDSTMSRAIVFNLRRKLPDESVERLRHAEPGLFEEIVCKLARFAEDYAPLVREARPNLPEALNDRDQDNWEPLLAIAQVAGPRWLERATSAALKLSRASESVVSIGNQLLADVQQVFSSLQTEKISTKDLITGLMADDEKPWVAYNHGKPITARQLAKLLSGYGIKSKTVRFGNSTPKGYEAAQFADAFVRYLPTPMCLPKRRNDTPNPNKVETLRDADTTSVAATPESGETPKPSPEQDCGGVADSSQDSDGMPTDLHPSDEDDDY
jgi:putative DNA primase/helicase